MSFDEGFGRVVRVTGYVLGTWAVATDRLAGTDLVVVITGFVGFEFVSRYRDRKVPELEDRHDDR